MKLNTLKWWKKMDYKEKYKGLLKDKIILQTNYNNLKKELDRFYMIYNNMNQEMTTESVVAEYSMRITAEQSNGLDILIELPKVVRLNGDRYTKNKEEK